MLLGVNSKLMILVFSLVVVVWLVNELGFWL